MTRYIYITSTSYSGSTLLTLLLNAHPEIATIGEVQKKRKEDLKIFKCSCGALWNRCRFWNQLISLLREQGYVYEFDDYFTTPTFQIKSSWLANKVIGARIRDVVFETLRDLFLEIWPGCKKRIQYLLSYHKVFADQVIAMNGAKIFVDSSKNPVHLRYLSKIPGLDVKVIHLIRDGRAFTNSYKKHYPEKTASEAAFEWKQLHKRVERVINRYHRGRSLKVHYEDLCDNPEKIMNTIFDFISVSPNTNWKNFRSKDHHVLGNSMRLKDSSEIRLDESWTRELSKKDINTFNNIAGKLNKKYGYNGKE